MQRWFKTTNSNLCCPVNTTDSFPTESALPGAPILTALFPTSTVCLTRYHGAEANDNNDIVQWHVMTLEDDWHIFSQTWSMFSSVWRAREIASCPVSTITGNDHHYHDVDDINCQKIFIKYTYFHGIIILVTVPYLLGLTPHIPPSPSPAFCTQDATRP